MISVNQLTIRFGAFALFNNISLLINNRDRIGLVGKNGAGKSTLLKAIYGIQPTEKGQIIIARDTSIGYLPQQMVLNDTRTVFEETKTAFSELQKIEKDINFINQQLAEREDYESEEYHSLINKLTELNERHIILDGGNSEALLEQTLLGLGFLRNDFNRHTSEFSGGWRMRIELAKILLQKPQYILLDEPTNHLDIESIQWLENLLKDYPGAIVLVSHDRKFLDTVTNRTIEMSLGKIYDYKVPYSKFVELQKERKQAQLAAYNNQQKQIQETELFIERFRYKATKAVQVQSRIKQLERLERIELEESEKASMKIKFPPAPHCGNVIIEAKRLSKNYDSLLVLDDIDLYVEKGEKISFIGKNGEGKTTLSRIIIGDIEFKGHLKIGHNVKVGYYAQNQAEQLHDNKTVFETIDDIAVGEIRTKIRDILGAFLFSGEDVDKKVSVLSGGERARLSLAKLLLEPYNMLVLDEPTNHLDMLSKDILKNALNEYDGTLIIVSHDRDFLDGLINKVYEFKNKKIREHIGGIYDFLQRKNLESLKELETAKKIAFIEKKTEIPSNNKKQYHAKKELEKELRKIKTKISKTEKNIQECELYMNEITDKLSNPANDNETIKELSLNYTKTKNTLGKEMNIWENLNIELEVFVKNNLSQ